MIRHIALHLTFFIACLYCVLACTNSVLVQFSSVLVQFQCSNKKTNLRYPVTDYQIYIGC